MIVGMKKIKKERILSQNNNLSKIYFILVKSKSAFMLDTQTDQFFFIELLGTNEKIKYTEIL